MYHYFPRKQLLVTAAQTFNVLPFRGSCYTFSLYSTLLGSLKHEIAKSYIYCHMKYRQ